MAEPFKNLINPGTVAEAGRHLQRAWPAFDRRRFESLAGTGLETLEFKARAMQLADALDATQALATQEFQAQSQGLLEAARKLGLARREIVERVEQALAGQADAAHTTKNHDPGKPQ